MPEKRREDMTSREYLDYLWEQSERPEVQEKLRALEPIATIRHATDEEVAEITWRHRERFRVALDRMAEWPDDGTDCA